MATKTEQTLKKIQDMRTIELFANQEPFIRRNIDLLDKALTQTIDEIILFINGELPGYKRVIQSLPDAGRPIGQGGWSDQRLLSIVDQVHSMAEEIKRTTGKHIELGSTEAFKDVYKNYRDILSLDGAADNISFSSLSFNQIEQLVEKSPIGGRQLEGLIDDIFTTAQKFDLRNELLVASIKGESIPKVTKRIQKKYPWLSKRQTDRLKKLGLTGRALERKTNKLIRENAITLARTHLQTVSVQAMESHFAENTDIIEGFEWNATLEPGYSRSGRGTCVRCASLDGQVYAKDEKRPEIPLHPRCRCLYTPVFDMESAGMTQDDAEQAIEANRGYAIRESDAQIAVGKGRAIGAGGRKILGSAGEKPAGRTYAEWYKDQNIFFRANLTGPSRADYLDTYKSKSLHDLVNKQTGELYTLDELSSRAKVVTREEYVKTHGTSKEKKIAKQNQ